MKNPSSAIILPMQTGVRFSLLALLGALLLSGCPRDSVSALETIPASTPTPPPEATPAPLPTPTPAPEPATPLPDNIVVLAAGKPAVITPGMSLTYLHIVNDSRCPAGVQCVWAGEVRINLVLDANGSRTPFDLSTRTRPKASLQGFEFELQSFGACPTGAASAVDSECATMKMGPQPLD